MEREGNGEDAGELFRQVSKKMRPVLGGEPTIATEEYLYETINLIEACKRQVEAEFLLSKNESVEDISTSTLQFLFLDLYIGKCYLSMTDLENRLVALLQAKDLLEAFLALCAQKGILSEEDAQVSANSGSVSAEEKRTSKIEKFKRDRAARGRIAELQRFLHITKADGEVDHEEEARELFLTQLQCYCREAMDDMDSLQQEMPMLRMMADRREQQEQQGHGQPGGGGSSSAGSSSAQSYQGRGPPPGSGPGISVTRTFKVGDQLMFSRDTVKASVFGFGIAAPTISLEEFGDQQKLEAEQRSQQQAEAESEGAAKSGRRFKQLEADGDEGDEDLMDQATMKDREWDEWKADNPRGWGNKMGKRF
ncbi:TAP42-like protein [Ochromonadaceae sp. CCMP2298]|nr:TAP42-like protein [Ochromonadaceae sp. CCMP2298]